MGLEGLNGQAPLGREGSSAFRRSGSIVRVLRTERWVRPTERAGSEGSYICRCLGQRKPYNRPGGRGNAIPLWWLAPPPFPLFEGALWMLSNGAMSLQESIERFILSPGWGGKGTRVTPANIF